MIFTTLDAWYDMADEHWTAEKCEAMEAKLMIAGRARDTALATLTYIRQQCEHPGNRGSHTYGQMCLFLEQIRVHAVTAIAALTQGGDSYASAANMLQTQRLLLATAGPPPDPAAIDPEAVRRHIRAARFDRERKVYEIAFADFVALIDTLDGRKPKGDG